MAASQLVFTTRLRVWPSAFENGFMVVSICSTPIRRLRRQFPPSSPRYALSLLNTRSRPMNSSESSTKKAGRSSGKQKGVKSKSATTGLPVYNVDAAGIDIGAEKHYVSVPEDRCEQPVQCFGCFTPDLRRMAKWLVKCGVKTVAMESTGVYWIPVFRMLEEHGLEVLLVDARTVKHLPGRKTDVLDCQWLRQLHTCGLLRGAFVPTHIVAGTRVYSRQRETLLQDCARCLQHMQKALTQMNLHLHVVLSDISGFSGMKILRAINRGERDPYALAMLAHPSVKALKQEIAKALTGHYHDEQLFILHQALDQYDFLKGQIDECDEKIKACFAKFDTMEPAPASEAAPAKRPRKSRSKNSPKFDLRKELIRISGVDLTRIDGIDTITAFTIISELGVDLSAFPNEKCFASWLGLCPNNRITGNRVKSTRTRKVQNRVANALRLSAQSLHRSKSYLGALYRRFTTRMAAPQSITAAAHRLAILVYRTLRYGHAYVDAGEEAYEQRHQERALKALTRKAKQLGYDILDPKTGECLA